MRKIIVPATALAVVMLVSHAFAQQTCLRPMWTECVSFPNGGRHTGIDAYAMPVQMDISPGADICVTNEWEIQADTYAQFSRNGMPWPNADWEVRVETFCFYRN